MDLETKFSQLAILGERQRPASLSSPVEKLSPSPADLSTLGHPRPVVPLNESARTLGRATEPPKATNPSLSKPGGSAVKKTLFPNFAQKVRPLRRDRQQEIPLSSSSYGKETLQHTGEPADLTDPNSDFTLNRSHVPEDVVLFRSREGQLDDFSALDLATRGAPATEGNKQESLNGPPPYARPATRNLLKDAPWVNDGLASPSFPAVRRRQPRLSKLAYRPFAGSQPSSLQRDSRDEINLSAEHPVLFILPTISEDRTGNSREVFCKVLTAQSMTGLSALQIQSIEAGDLEDDPDVPGAASSDTEDDDSSSEEEFSAARKRGRSYTARIPPPGSRSNRVDLGSPPPKRP